MDKGKSGYALKKIVAIMQDTICSPRENHFELEIILKGVAFFKKENVKY
ncbi:hypothetical protein KAT24_01500 [Candidatus Pacearchaeota archaeon]|nr:hypothetical protein [Candidatus Pacearchaeota archaeon]